MSIYTPEIKEEVSENAKMLVVEEDGKVYQTEMPSIKMPSKTIITFKGDDFKDLYINGEYVCTGDRTSSVIDFVSLGDKIDELKEKIFDADIFMENSRYGEIIKIGGNITVHEDSIYIAVPDILSLFLYRYYPD